MDLNSKDVSHLLMIPEKEVMGMVKQKQIPYHELNDKPVFNKQTIIEWALSRNLPINVSGHAKFSEYHIETLGSLLTAGSFHYGCKLEEESYIEEIVAGVDFEKSVDKGIIVQLLKSREEMMSTAIGNGISLPHPRVPLMVGRDKPLINFFFPEKPLPLKSIDGKPVHTIILLISQTIKQHLSLIAHLSFLLSHNEFRNALENRFGYEECISIIAKIETARVKKNG